MPTANTRDEPYTAGTRIETVAEDPVFGDYGRLLFPVERLHERRHARYPRSHLVQPHRPRRDRGDSQHAARARRGGRDGVLRHISMPSKKLMYSSLRSKLLMPMLRTLPWRTADSRPHQPAFTSPRKWCR